MGNRSIFRKVTVRLTYGQSASENNEEILLYIQSNYDEIKAIFDENSAEDKQSIVAKMNAIKEKLGDEFVTGEIEFNMKLADL